MPCWGAALLGMFVAFAWYIGDRFLYDYVQGTWLAALMDRLIWLVFWPVSLLWKMLYSVGLLPLSDYRDEFIVYYALRCLWLIVVGGILGLLCARAVHAWRKTRKSVS